MTTAQFDYDALDAETRIVVRQKTDEIREKVRRAAGDIVEIGERLITVKEQLGHDNFGKWLLKEFAWSESAARKMMSVARTFKTVNFTDLRIAPSALYLLASDSTPDDIRTEFIEESKVRRVEHKEVAERLATEKPANIGRVEPRPDPVIRTLASEIGEDEPRSRAVAERGDEHSARRTKHHNEETSVSNKSEKECDSVKISIDTTNPAATAATMARALTLDYLDELIAELSAVVSRTRAAKARGLGPIGKGKR